MTAAVAPPAPATDALAELLAWGEGLEAVQDQVRALAGCEHPIRVAGSRHTVDGVTGELTASWSTEGRADGTVWVPCKNRRASRCEPCSRVYQGDAYQLVVAGLRGGKGVPEHVQACPAVFVTLTAPSFGPVHTRRADGSCLPRRAADVCEHRCRIACAARHSEDDPLLGQPICPWCFDYTGAALWNAGASELWRRTGIGIYRALARALGRTERQVRREVSVQYVKAAEFQRRGLLHFHLAVRLDAADRRWSWPEGVLWREPHRFAPPPAEYTADLLADAVRDAAASTSAPLPKPVGDLPRIAARRQLAEFTADRIAARAKRRASRSVEVDPAAGRTDRHLSAVPTPDVEAGQGPPAVREADDEVTLDARLCLDAETTGSGRTPHPAAVGPALTSTAQVRQLGPPARATALEAICWGDQVDVRPIPVADQRELGEHGYSRERIAGYLAKYATKHTEALGGLDRRLDVGDVPHLAVNAHIHRLVVTCWLLAHWYPARRLDAWSHQLGYGGHWLTKSRRYSTTFTRLRHARVLWAQRRQLEAMAQMDPWDRLRAAARTVVWTRWQVKGIGHPDAATHLLAATARRDAIAARTARAEQRADLADLHAYAT